MSSQVAHILELVTELDRGSQWQLIQHITLMMQVQEETDSLPLSEAWKKELASRLEGLDSGRMASRPWRDVISEMKAKG